ncbi:MAG: hypothetical protein J7L74_02250 [Candidatus Hydrothermae bacterium]|nr:hypothetical protein [Candidatus Hydrothermae bacterium]
MHYAGRYEASNIELEKAERLREELYTHSLTKEAASLLTSENVKPYRGDDFEDVLINYYKALNYLYLNKREDALVELRRADEKLAYLNLHYEHKNVYRSDAFMEFLSGLFHEMGGEYNDALVSYRRALESYEDYRKFYGLEPPEFLIKRLLLAAKLSEIYEVYEEISSRFPGIEPASREKGLLIVILECGQMPGKKEDFVEIPVREKNDTYIVRVAFSYYEPSPIPVVSAALLADNLQAELRTMEDIQAIAIKNLEDKKAREIAKATLRATAKYLAYRKAREETEKYARKKKKSDEEAELLGLIVGKLVNIFTYTTERADTRSWLGLPQTIMVGYMELDPGSYAPELRVRKRNGSYQTLSLPAITLQSGEIKILSRRIFN